MRNTIEYFDYQGIYMKLVGNEGIYFKQCENGSFLFKRSISQEDQIDWHHVSVYRSALSPYEKMLADYLFDYDHDENRIYLFDKDESNEYAYFAYLFNPITSELYPLYISDSRELIETQKINRNGQTSDGFVYKYCRVSSIEQTSPSYDIYSAIDELLYQIDRTAFY